MVPRAMKAYLNCVLVLAVGFSGCTCDSEENWQVLDVRLKEARMGAAGATLDGRIYVFGGKSSSFLASAEAFDPLDGVVQPLEPMKTAREEAKAATVSGAIYLFGGETSVGRTDLVERYDPETDSYVPVASMPERKKDMAVGVIDGLIYICGGDTGTWSKRVDAFDPQTNTCERLADMHTPRKDAGAVAVEGKLYVFGGTNNAGTLTSTESYDPQSKKWTLRSSMPEGASSMAVGEYQGLIHLFGGRVGEDQYSATVYQYNPMNDKWKKLSDMPFACEEVVCGQVGTAFYLLSGHSGDGMALRSILRFGPAVPAGAGCRCHRRQYPTVLPN